MIIVIFMDNENGNELIVQSLNDFNEVISFIEGTLRNWKTSSYKEIRDIRIDIQENR